LKPSAEQQFLYGNNVLKSGIARLTEGIEARQGVVVYSLYDKPLGFGVTAKGTTESRRADPTALIVLHQADLGNSFKFQICNAGNFRRVYSQRRRFDLSLFANHTLL
jgi:hypothetical protein